MTLDKFNEALDLQEKLDCLRELDNARSIIDIGAHRDSNDFGECQVTLSHPYGKNDRGTNIRLTLEEWELINELLKENISKEIASLENEFNNL